MDGFAYNQSVELSATDQTVYQQGVVIHRAAGIPYEELVGGLYVLHFYVGDKCKADYGDIRFTDAAGNALAYYLWPDYDAESARFTVRLEGATISGQIRVWYGNSGAITTSDPNATYFLHDDAEIGNISDKWSISQGSFTHCLYTDVRSATGKRSICLDSNSAGSPQYIIANLPPICSDRKFEVSARLYDSGDTSCTESFRINTTGSITVLFGVWTGGSASKYVVYKHPEGWTATSVDRSVGWHKYTVRWDGATVTTLIDDVTVLIEMITDIPVTIDFGTGYTSYLSTLYIDDVLVRAYSATPPSATAFSGEQVVGGSKASTGVALGSANMMVI